MCLGISVNESIGIEVVRGWEGRGESIVDGLCLKELKNKIGLEGLSVGIFLFVYFWEIYFLRLDEFFLYFIFFMRLERGCRYRIRFYY